MTVTPTQAIQYSTIFIQYQQKNVGCSILNAAVDVNGHIMDITTVFLNSGTMF